MADKVARFKQYEYRANSNLVLQAERTGPRVTEPTGEVESLRGKLAGSMGDRVQFGRPPEDMLSKMRKRAEKNRKSESELRKKLQHDSVLSAKIDSSVYKPKTRENRAIYESFLDKIQSILIDQPSSVLESCADELLHLYKNDNIVEQDRKSAVIELLGITDRAQAEEAYTNLFHLAKKITDFIEDEDMDEEQGETEIALVFNDEESGDEDVYEVKEEESEDEDGDPEIETNVLTGGGLGDDMDIEEEENLDPRDIDAFWIQREVSKFDEDKISALNISQEILKILGEDTGLIDCENHLVELLGYDHFGFVKILMSHRKKILFCTLLKQAQSEEEKETIRKQMIENGLERILDILDGKK